MIQWQTPLTKDMIAKAGYVYLPEKDVYYRYGSNLSLKFYPGAGTQGDVWVMTINPAGQPPVDLCEVQGLSHLLILSTVLEGDGNVIVFDVSKTAEDVTNNAR